MSLTAAQKRALRERLERLRDELLRQGPQRIEPLRRDPAQVGATEEDEQALVEMLQILASGRNRQQADVLALVQRALRKLDQAPASYGLCEECEEELPYRRLELMPYAPLCTECQAETDPVRNQGRRKLTDFR